MYIFYAYNMICLIDERIMANSSTVFQVLDFLNQNKASFSSSWLEDLVFIL